MLDEDELRKDDGDNDGGDNEDNDDDGNELISLVQGSKPGGYALSLMFGGLPIRIKEVSLWRCC